MIKFFRRIRKRLLTENKFTKYLLYAAGEVLLVVIGILIALQVNNWNEDRKQQNRKKSLIENLINDFENSKNNIRNSREVADSLLKQMDLFAELLPHKDRVSVDSLKILGRAFFSMIALEPSLTFYKQAENNGTLELLDNDELFVLFNRFEERNNMQKMVMNNFVQGYSSGYIWDLRKTVGSIYNVRDGRSSSFHWTKSDDTTYEEYYEIIMNPVVIAALQNQRQLYYSLYTDLVTLDEIADDILEKLQMEGKN